LTGKGVVSMLFNCNQNTVLADKVTVVETFPGRMKGLLGKKRLAKDEAMLLKPCKQVHTLFMKFPIDVVFLDEQCRVVHIKENLKSFSVSPYVENAKCVIEFPAGKVRETGLGINDRLMFKNTSGKEKCLCKKIPE